jgi:UDP-N-acetylglucosamine diphosphorylase/glucosamine-1-phosphate N-acetyltransferase
LNGAAIQTDFDFLTQGRKSAPLSKSNQIIGDANQIFLEEGAVVECAILNTKNGPIYIGKNAEIMEGSVVRGALAMCANSQLKMSTKVYGAVTLGPYSKVGGEIADAILIGYANKAHDGFLGYSILGEWCNIGADTNTANLKNTYEEIKLWDYTKNSFARTGQQFLGLIMGDHSKCAINTMFNSGTVVGVSANIYGAGFPRNFIPSFSWGGAGGYETFDLEKAYFTAERVMARRNKTLSPEDREILGHVYKITAQYRSWEKA